MFYNILFYFVVWILFVSFVIINILIFKDMKSIQFLLNELNNSEIKEAMDIYSQVLESPLMDEIEWMSRILHGFSRTALALEKPDIAIASLQEAAQADPQNPEIFRTLTEAFTAADLTKEATGIYYQDVTLDDTGIWYYRFEGSGAVVSADEGQLIVERSEF